MTTPSEEEEEEEEAGVFLALGQLICLPFSADQLSSYFPNLCHGGDACCSSSLLEYFFIVISHGGQGPVGQGVPSGHRQGPLGPNGIFPPVFGGQLENLQSHRERSLSMTFFFRPLPFPFSMQPVANLLWRPSPGEAEASVETRHSRADKPPEAGSK